MDRTEQTFQETADAYYESRFSDIARLLKLRDQASVLGHEEWYENMTEQLEQMPLAVDMLTHSPRFDDEWEILLGTGGPADRVLVHVDELGAITDAEYQYQDWFKPWTRTQQDYKTVVAFAEVFAPWMEACRYCALDRDGDY